MLPTRSNFLSDLFNQNELYTTSSPPTQSLPTPSTLIPTGERSCEDSPFRFKVVKNGNRFTRDCIWVSKRATKSRCRLGGVKGQCPSTCGTCSNCVDSNSRIQFKYNNKKITRDCIWVANKNTQGRCKIPGMEYTCRVTCSTC